MALLWGVLFGALVLAVAGWPQIRNAYWSEERAAYREMRRERREAKRALKRMEERR